MKRLLLILAVLLVPTLAHAQTITGITLQAMTGGTPVGTPSVTVLTAWTCNQPAPVTPSGTVLNPRTISVPDPILNPTGLLTGPWCVLKDNGTNGPISKLPFGSAIDTMVASFVNSVGASPSSPGSNPFSEPGTSPNAPTAIVLTP